MADRFIQFELWKECKQGCKFCCNKGAKPINKANSFKHILETLNNLEVGEFDSFGLIGGELFNGEMEHYMNQFSLVIQKIKELNPKNIYIATSLIYNIDDYLVPVLKALEKVLGITDKITLCTSWDIEGRFKTPEEQTLWAKNMMTMHRIMPQVKMHTEIILTQAFLDLVNSGKWDINQFKQVFYTTVDFIEPSSGLYYHDKYECQKDIPYFFPTKSSFIQFINNIKDDYDISRLCSTDLRADELHYFDGLTQKIAKNRRATGCREHSSDTSKKYDIGFIDSDEDMRDVVLQVMELLNV